MNTKETTTSYKDATFDVAIIGGSASGLLLAHALFKKGHEVVLLEKESCGSGSMSKSSGLISPNFELSLHETIKHIGEEQSKGIWNLLNTETARLKNISSEIETEIDSQDSICFSTTPHNTQTIENEYESHKKFGSVSRLLNKEQLNKIFASNKAYSAIRYPGSFGIDTPMFFSKLNSALRNGGVKIHESTPVVRIEKNRIITTKNVVTAKYIIICTNSGTEELIGIKSRLYKTKTYMGQTETLAYSESSSIFKNEHLIAWEMSPSRTHFRITKENKVLLGSQNPDIENILPSLFPIASIPIKTKWAHTYQQSADTLPYAGKTTTASTYYINGAHSVLWASALASYIAQKITENRDDLDQVFNNNRPISFFKKIKAAIKK